MRRVSVRLYSTVLLAACGGGPVEAPPVGPAVSVRPLAIELDAIGARERASATVFDGAGMPVPGAAVTWRSLDTSVATVDSGLVSARQNGRTMVTARYDTLVGTVEVTVAQVGVTLFKISGDAQVGTVGFPLNRPLVARVDDRLGNPVQGVSVFFRIVSGGGVLETQSPRTNADGIAQTTWTLGPNEGDQIVAASLTPGAVTPALYNAIATSQ